MSVLRTINLMVSGHVILHPASWGIDIYVCLCEYLNSVVIQLCVAILKKTVTLSGHCNRVLCISCVCVCVCVCVCDGPEMIVYIRFL